MVIGGRSPARVNLATKLRFPLDQVDAALSEGRITVEHARALVRAGNPRVLDELAETQGDWVAAAQDRPFRVWVHELRVWAELVDQDGPFDPNAELARNKLSLRPFGRGIKLSGELHGVEAIAVQAGRRSPRHRSCGTGSRPTTPAVPTTS